MFKRHTLPHTKPLLVCALTDALAFNLDFPSTLPPLFDLANDRRFNHAEGVVICLLKSAYSHSKRVIFKRKAVQFMERVMRSYATKSKRRDRLKLARRELDSYVCMNRQTALVSKLGPLAQYIKLALCRGGQANKKKRDFWDPLECGGFPGKSIWKKGKRGKKNNNNSNSDCEDGKDSKQQQQQHNKEEVVEIFLQDCLDDALLEHTFNIPWTRLSQPDRVIVLEQVRGTIREQLDHSKAWS